MEISYTIGGPAGPAAPRPGRFDITPRRGERHPSLG